MGTGFLGFDDQSMFDLDFNVADFNLLDNDSDAQPEKQDRILQPRIDKDSVTNHVMYENAEAFAEQIDLDPNVRTFAWVSGSFVFGDIIEALLFKRGVVPRELYICTLSISQENIDSLVNVMDTGYVERLVLVISGYFYSHEKFKLVPYMYEQLDQYGDRVHIVFGNYHAKIITMRTVLDHYITIHGSSNMRSSNSIEQMMLEQSKELHEFNAAIMDRLVERFDTINHNAPPTKLKRLEGKKSWQVVL